MRILICGAEGQLGRALRRTQPAQLGVEYASRSGLDICAPDQLSDRLHQLTPNLIINAAAYTAVDRAEAEVSAAYECNATAVSALAQAAHRLGARVIHISTDFVFDGRAHHPYRPGDVCAPLNVYGASKLAGEEALRCHLPQAHLILRTSWVYGMDGRNFVKTILNRLQQGQALRVVNDQRGGPTWVDGLARVLWRLALGPVDGRTLHWSDAGDPSWYELALAVQEEALAIGLISEAVEIQPVASADYAVAARRPAYSVLDCAETVALTQLTQVPWREQLRCMLQQCREQVVA